MTNTVLANKKIEIFACYLINYRFRFKFHEKRNNYLMILRVASKKLEGGGRREQYDLLNFFEEVNYKKEQKSWKFFCF